MYLLKGKKAVEIWNSKKSYTYVCQLSVGILCQIAFYQTRKKNLALLIFPNHNRQRKSFMIPTHGLILWAIWFLYCAFYPFNSFSFYELDIVLILDCDENAYGQQCWFGTEVNVISMGCYSVCLSLCLSDCLTVCSVCLSVCLFVWMSLCLYVYINTCVCVYVCVFVGLSACLSVYQSVYLSVRQSDRQTVRQAVSQSVCLPVCLPECLFVSLSGWLVVWLSGFLPACQPV